MVLVEQVYTMNFVGKSMPDKVNDWIKRHRFMLDPSIASNFLLYLIDNVCFSAVILVEIDLNSRQITTENVNYLEITSLYSTCFFYATSHQKAGSFQ